MLLVKMDIATPFIDDFHFYHHPRSDITRRLRRRSLAGMEAAKPRFVIDSVPNWRPTGPDTAQSFPEKEKLIADHCRTAWSGKRLTLLERGS